MSNPDRLGSKVGPKVAGLVSQHVIAAQQALAPLRAKVAQASVNAVLGQIASQTHRVPNPLLRRIADSPEAPEDIAAFLKHWAGTPDLMAIIGDIYGIFGVVSACSQVGQNALAPLTQSFLAAEPHAILPPAQLAQLQARNWLSFSDAAAEAAKGGLDEDRFNLLASLSMTLPQAAELFSLVNRGELPQSEMSAWLKALGYPPELIEHLATLAGQRLPPALVADLVLRGWMSTDDGAAEAQASGVDAQRFALMVDGTGEPLALEEMLLLYRRGQMDKATLQRGIKESRVRDEWIPYAELLRYQPASPQEAIDALVKGHLDQDTALAKYQVAGGDPDDFSWRYATVGNPPGASEELALMNRGVVSEDHVRQALRQGHLADAYIDDVIALRRRMLELGTLQLAQQSGTITDDELTDYLEDLGYNATDSATLVATGSRQRVALELQLAKQVIADGYLLGALSTDEATKNLVALGYTEHEAAFILEVCDLQRQLAAQKTAIGKVQTHYITHKMSTAQATAALQALHVSAEMIAVLLAEWQVAQEGAAPVLTAAEIADAAYYDVIPDADAMTALQSLGYTAHDSWVILSVRAHGPIADVPEPA